MVLYDLGLGLDFANKRQVSKIGAQRGGGPVRETGQSYHSATHSLHINMYIYIHTRLFTYIYICIYIYIHA